MQAPLLEMTGIAKSFPGVRALSSVNLTVGRGEIHALLGENGAGKSTLLKILSGAQRPDAGTIAFKGQEVDLPTPQAAQRLGISTIYQEFTLIPDLSIAENIFIGREPGSLGVVNWRRMIADAREVCRRVGLKRDPRTRTRDLSVAEQQLVEIARALSMSSRLIIMDEPTAALSAVEVEKLFDIARRLRDEGIGVILVTHRLEEAKAICDRFTVLRDGSDVGCGAIKGTAVAEIIRLMVGRDVSDHPMRGATGNAGATVLAVSGLSRARRTNDVSSIELADISFEARKGEVLGIAGLVGSGRTEVARAIFGADRFDEGAVLVNGRPLQLTSPRDAIRAGIGLVPEDRKNQALFLALSIRENLSISTQHRLLKWGAVVDRAAEARLVEDYRQALNIRMAGAEQIVANLSGGNQQKVILARWLSLKPDILIVDEPTRGIDIGAKAEVHALLRRMAEAGMAVVVISSELPEIMRLSDRIVTMREGRVTGEMAADEATPEQLMSLMMLQSAACGSEP